MRITRGSMAALSEALDEWVEAVGDVPEDVRHWLDMQAVVPNEYTRDEAREARAAVVEALPNILASAKRIVALLD